MSAITAKQNRSKTGVMDEFDRFIDAPADKEIEGRPLQWWLLPQQQRLYPRLATMAIDVLSAPAMSAEDERIFSATRRTIPWTRARLSGAVIEHLECVKHWQRTGLIDEQFSELLDEQMELEDDEEADIH